MKINENIKIGETEKSLKSLIEEQSSINSNFAQINLQAIAVNTSTNETLCGSYTIPEDGLYLITGTCNPNYFGVSGREIHTYLKKNDVEIWKQIGVVNTNAYVLSREIAYIGNFNKNDVIAFSIKSTTASNWAFTGGTLRFVKLK